MLTPDLFTAADAESADRRRLPLVDADVEYYPAFVDQETAHRWFSQLMQDGAVAWRHDSMMMYGRRVPIPRLNAWYGDEGLGYTYSGIPMDPEPWTRVLADIRVAVEAAAVQPFTSALLNLYRDHNDSVAWHADDEPELGPRPVIASLSLGASREFQMRHRDYRRNGTSTFTLSLEPGSLLIMRGETQRNWVHQIPKRAASRVEGPRINITFRNICRP